MTAKPASVGEWNAWKMTQYEITCSTLSAIIESSPVVKYARNGPWRIAAKDVPVGAVALVRAMRSGYRNAHGGPGGPPCARVVRTRSLYGNAIFQRPRPCVAAMMYPPFAWPSDRS